MTFKIKGGQISNSTIEQQNLNITTESVTGLTSVTTQGYVITAINANAGLIKQSWLNQNMTANAATVGELASDTAVIEFPISNVMVKINGVLINVGSGQDCYFSPDGGTTIRTGGLAQKADYLYWNSSQYNLEANDEIDFVYLVAQEHFVLNAGSSVVLNPMYNTLVVKYEGGTGTTMTVTIDGNNYTVGNVAGQFVWDIGGIDEHTFTTSNEAILVNINGEDYTVWFDGFGSLLFSVKKGDFTVPVYFHIGTGFNDAVYDINVLSNNEMIIVGDFTSYSGSTKNRILKLNSEGIINNSFNIGTGVNFPGYKKTLIRSDNRLILGGNFTTYNSTTVNRIVCINTDGSIYSGFSMGSGFNNSVHNLTVQSDDKVICCGVFTTYSGITCKNIIRLNSGGTIDDTFDVGTGFNLLTQQNPIVIQSDNKILIGGGFTTYSGITSNHIIRLNPNGTIDNTFTIGTGFNGSVYAIAIQPDNKLVISGNFTSYSGTTINRIIRLNSGGTIDNTFNVGSGFNSPPTSIVLQPDGKILMIGTFTTYKGITKNRIIRLNSDGSIDNSFLTGVGFSTGVPNDIKLQYNKKIIVGGLFTSYNNISYNRIVRINSDGSSNTI
jgi:uncharacterized delta-60 repeat protein